LLFPQLQQRDWTSINALFHEAGMTPVNSGFDVFFAFTPGSVFAFKLTVFLLILAMASAVYLIAVEAGLNRLLAWLLAALAMTFPGFQDWVLLATAASVFDYALFMVATLLLLYAEHGEPRRRIVLRAVAIISFALGFSLNSLLTLYFGSLLLLLALSLRTASLKEVIRTRWLYAAGLLLLPFAYWGVSRALFKPSGLYAGFNAITFMPSTILRGYRYFAANGVAEQLLQSAAVLLRPWTWPVIVVIGVVLAVAWKRRRPPSAPSRSLAAGGMALGLVALGLGVLPYTVVGDYPAVHGWDTRHDLLVGVPLAVILVSAIAFVFRAGRAAWLGAGALGLLVLGFSAAGIQDYAALQARWATDRAVEEQLRADPTARNYSIFWVDDQAPGPEDYYRFYEWSAMLQDVYGGQARVGLDRRGYDPRFLFESQFFNDRYDLAGFDPHGCQADLTIERRPGASSTAQVAMSYTFYRLLQPERLDGYLRGLVEVKIVPRPSVAATDCAQ
jgi:hypothetical protein